MPEAHRPKKGQITSFHAYWLAETLRLREALWGPVEDAMEVRRARAQGEGFEQRVMLRAGYLAQSEKLDLLVRQWTQGSRIPLTGLYLLALRARLSSALGPLGGRKSV